MTQPAFCDEDIENCYNKKETGARILCGIMPPLVSFKNASFMRE